MYTLTLVLAWVLTGPVAELDGHPMFVDTLGGQIHLTGFPDRASCMGYQYSLPVQLNGVAQPYQVVSKSCHRVRQSAVSQGEEIVSGPAF